MKKIILIIIALITFNGLAINVKLGEVLRPVDVIDNPLIGYGIVIGLNGTGDRSKLAVESIVNMLKKMGIRVDPTLIKTKNCAAVVVTATLPAFAAKGDRIDVSVSSLADAKDLSGGVLIQTPLTGPDGKIYAVAQGPVSIGGFNAGMGGGNKGGQKNHPTSARIPSGAIVQREVPVKLTNFDGSIICSLKYKDFEFTNKVCDKINATYGPNTAVALEAGKIKLNVPLAFAGNPISFLGGLQNLEVDYKMLPTIVINEKTATVVMGGDIKIEPTVISHNAITVQINGKKQRSFKVKAATIDELVNLLNMLNLQARDIIAIIQALANSGAINAQIKMM